MGAEITITRLESFVGGWVVGNFTPTLFDSDLVEIGVKILKKGTIEQEHFQSVATEHTIVVSGNCVLGGKVLSAGDIATIPPNVSASFRSLTDLVLVVIKEPSRPGDKTLGQGAISYG